jgi:hypothetical protein
MLIVYLLFWGATPQSLIGLFNVLLTLSRRQDASKHSHGLTQNKLMGYLLFLKIKIK